MRVASWRLSSDGGGHGVVEVGTLLYIVARLLLIISENASS